MAEEDKKISPEENTTPEGEQTKTEEQQPDSTGK